MAADARVQAYAVDDGPGVQPLDLRICIELVEIADAQRQVGVGEKLHGLGLGEAHVQHIDIRLERALLKHLRKRDGGRPCALIASDDNAAGIKVVIQRHGFAQEFRTEHDAVRLILRPHLLRITHRDGRLDDHHGIIGRSHHLFDHRLHSGAVEEILLRVVVGRCGNDDEVGGSIGGGAVGRRLQAQHPGSRFRLGQILLDVLILDRGDETVDFVHLLRDDVNGGDPVVLCQENGQ